MTRKTIISVVIALTVAGIVVYVVENHFRPGLTTGGLLAGSAISSGLLLLRNKFVLFIEILSLALIAYFTWKWDVKEIAISAPAGAAIGALLVWGWLLQHKPYRHSEYKTGQHSNQSGGNSEVPR